MTFIQIMQNGPTLRQDTLKHDDDIRRWNWQVVDTHRRWKRIAEKRAARRSAIKARWNRYRRLCGLPLSH